MQEFQITKYKNIQIEKTPLIVDEKQQEYDSEDEEQNESIDRLDHKWQKDFLTNILSKDQEIILTMIEYKSGFMSFKHQYEVYIGYNMKYLCTINKINFRKKSTYLFQLVNEGIKRQSELCIAKLIRKKNVFYLYDNGDNPKRTKDKSKMRQELAIIIYNKTPFTNIILANPLCQFRPKDRNSCLFQAFQSLDYKQRIYHLICKKSDPNIFDRDLGELDVRSVQPEKKKALQLRKFNPYHYCITIKFPLTVIQALGIIIAKFDYII